MDNYVPQPGVIEQNEAFDYALKSAPNVLYARFKQFGQVRRLTPLVSERLISSSHLTPTRVLLFHS